jgi:hypothetical protein
MNRQSVLLTDQQPTIYLMKNLPSPLAGEGQGERGKRCERSERLYIKTKREINCFVIDR